MSRRILFLFFMFAFGMGIWSLSARAEIPCAKIMPGAEVPSGFGVPYNVEGSSFRILSGQCRENAFTVVAGNWDNSLYIYKYGYVWNDTLKKWERFEFRGARSSGEWFSGHASASISRSLGELRQNNYVLAYMCKKTNGAWKCGCRDRACAVPSWQLQTYSIGDTHEAVFSVPVLPPVSEVLVSNLSAMSGTPGSGLLISGGGFTDDNTILFGNYRIAHVAPQSGSAIQTGVPDIPFGRYEVFVENKYGRSAYPMFFVVKRAGAQAPRVTSVLPNRVRIGGTVTLYGEGFTPANNSIFTGFEWIDGLSSKDGSSITFQADFFSKYGANDPKARSYIRAASSTSHVTFPVIMTVANENGIAINGSLLTLEL